VLPAHSGKVSISAFCVEHGRWTKRGEENDAQFSASKSALPAKSLKLAVREDKDQSKVWDAVANTQARMAAGMGRNTATIASPSPTSMQLALENKTVVEQTNAYVHPLEKIIEGKSDVIGYAYTINGKLNSAEVYASHDLFRRMWSKMLQASATEALAEKNAGKASAPADVAAVKSALDAADRAKPAGKDSSGRVEVVKKSADKVVLFESRDQKQPEEWLHKSYVVK
jgi:hypothetical protein